MLTKNRRPGQFNVFLSEASTFSRLVMLYAKRSLYRF